MSETIDALDTIIKTNEIKNKETKERARTKEKSPTVIDLIATLAPHYYGRLDGASAAAHIDGLVDELIAHLRGHPSFAALNLSSFELELGLGDFRTVQIRNLANLMDGAVLFDRKMSEIIDHLEDQMLEYDLPS